MAKRLIEFRFLSTLSLRRATVSRIVVSVRYQFLSTLSLRRATLFIFICGGLLSDFYPRSPCGERPRVFQLDKAVICISIHALLAESDNYRLFQSRSCQNFYPRSPCGERLLRAFNIPAQSRDFYPRSPCGERRRSAHGKATPIQDFYPRSPCGERPPVPLKGEAGSKISIHALLAESDV